MLLESVVLGVKEQVFLKSEAALRGLLGRIHCDRFVPNDDGSSFAVVFMVVEGKRASIALLSKHRMGWPFRYVGVTLKLEDKLQEDSELKR